LFFFSIIKYQRPEKITQKKLDKIKKLSRKHRALFAKVEPMSEGDSSQLTAHRFKPDKWPLSVTKTIYIDLTPPLDKIRASLKKDTRYCLRGVDKNQLKVNIISNSRRDFRRFHGLWKKTAKRGKFCIPSEKEFLNKARCLGEKASLVSVYRADKSFLAGAFVAVQDDTCYYLHAASSLKGRKLYAPYLCLWEIIKLAKSKGCSRLDLEGIYDPRFKKMTKKWKGFSHFKRGWGGVESEFPGSYIKYLPGIL
jgi:lipid II:glycine glycyltransferase (peptidoglycan interpeptide bridge formation enzyme)